MMTKTLAFVAVLGTSLLLACDQNAQPPPQFNMTMDSGGTKLMPIRLVKRDRNALIAAASTTETPAPASGGTAASSTAAAVPIDDSSPEAIANTMVAMVKAGSFAQLADIVVPEQKETVQQVLGLVQPVLEAQAELKKALDEKFPGHAIKLPGTGSVPGGLSQELTITDIKTIDDDNAEGTAHAPTAEGEKTDTIKFKRIDGKWRIVDPDLEKLPAAGELQKMADVMSKMAEAMKSITKKVTDGELADAKAAEAELGKAMLGLMMGLMQGGAPPAPDTGDKAAPAPDSGDKEKAAPAPDTGEKDKAAPTTPAPPSRTRRTGRPGPVPGDAKAKPKERERDEVDQTFTGPNMLRNR